MIGERIRNRLTRKETDVLATAEAARHPALERYEETPILGTPLGAPTRLDPSPLPPVCELHDWPAVSERGNGRLAPPRSECPSCKADAMAEYRRPKQSELDAMDKLEVDVSSPRQAENIEWVAWEEELSRREMAGQPRPGSLEEMLALERLDHLRNYEEARARGPKIIYSSWDGQRTMREGRKAYEARIKRLARKAGLESPDLEYGFDFPIEVSI